MAVADTALDRCPHCGALDIVTRGGLVECLHCRKAMRLADLVACPGCGEVLPSATATCEPCAAALAALGDGSATGVKGIGGWLLVLAVYLTGVGPVKFLMDVVQLMAASRPGTFDADLGRFAWAAVAVEAAVTAALALGGIQILARRPGAIRYCRRVLLLAPVVGLVELMVAMRMGVLFDAALPAVAFGQARSALVTLGWLAYLHGSKRVRETFPD